MKHLEHCNKYCDCIEPAINGNNEQREFISIGTSPNRMDFEICCNCQCPIMGTSSTHME